MKILFNVFPPNLTYAPEIGQSVLKAYLKKEGFDSKIIYWNVLFKNLMINVSEKYDPSEINDTLLPFIYMLEGQNCNITALMDDLLSNKPQLSVWDKYKELSFLDDICFEIESIIKSVLEDNNYFSDYDIIGISYKFNQWIPGLIFIRELKKRNPSIKCLIGGIPTKNETYAIMDLFEVFDFGIWGEGEYPLTLLMKHLECNKILIDDIPSLIYKKNNQLTSNTTKNEYTFLITPDYTDYFEYSLDKDYYLLLESSRSCSWKGCKFCYLNQGYKFRTKTTETLISEIDYLSKKHETSKFTFVDNDFICGDYERVNKILDLIIEYKQNINPKITFHMAEINSALVDKTFIERLKNAGFSGVQIGFEASSDSLLKKMNKQSRFINHILAIKLCNENEINILGMNIIQNIIDEDINDIDESIKNLHYLRFEFRKGLKIHCSNLAIRSSSKYYKGIKNQNQLNDWYFPLEDIFPEKYKKYKFELFCNYPKSNNRHWIYFNKMVDFYQKNKFTYRVKIIDKNTIIYKEFFNRKIVNELLIDGEIERTILFRSASKIVSIEYLLDILLKIDPQITRLDITTVAYNLHNERLVFYDCKTESILSLINCDV